MLLISQVCCGFTFCLSIFCTFNISVVGLCLRLEEGLNSKLINAKMYSLGKYLMPNICKNCSYSIEFSILLCVKITLTSRVVYEQKFTNKFIN